MDPGCAGGLPSQEWSPGSHDVLLRYRDDAVELVVRDDGLGGHAGGDGRGQGLAGMRERVDLHDGTLAAGPHEGGGFDVRSVMPA